LPDGLFWNQKSQFGLSLVGLAMENIGIFYNHLVYFTAIGNILWPFGIFCGHLVYFSPFLVFCTRKNLATLVNNWASGTLNGRSCPPGWPDLDGIFAFWSRFLAQEPILLLPNLQLQRQRCR
jgi:hypothetical protein